MSSVNIRPMRGKLLCRLVKMERSIKGSLLMINEQRKANDYVEVVALGDAKEDEEWPFSAGDIVLLDKYAGADIQLDGDDYLMVDLAQVIAIVRQK